MKKMVLVIFVAGIAWRIHLWALARDQILNLCPKIESSSLVVEGDVTLSAYGSYSLESALLEIEGQSFSWMGYVSVTLAEPYLPLQGNRVRFLLPPRAARCKDALKNPSQVSSPAFFLKLPKLNLTIDRAAFVTSRPGSFESLLDRLFRSTPELLGIEKAIWMGNTQGISPDLLKAFVEAGLIPLIALSGQHVGAFSVLILLLLKPVTFLLWRMNFSLSLHRVMPCLGALVLWFTSGGQTCMERVLVMSLILYGVSSRGFYLSSDRLVACTLSFILLWSPEKIGNLSFVLSIVATAFLVHLMQRKSAWSAYLQTSLLMPVLMIPLIAHYQGKWAVTAPFYSVVLGWFWDLIVLPLGFFLPFFVLITPASLRADLLFYVEKGWIALQSGLQIFFEKIKPWWVSCYRPSFWETALLIGIIVLILKEITKRQRDALVKI